MNGSVNSVFRFQRPGTLAVLLDGGGKDGIRVMARFTWNAWQHDPNECFTAIDECTSIAKITNSNGMRG